MSPSPTSEERNPYAPSADWKPGQDTFTAQAAGIWDEGFAAGRAAATPDPPEGETLALHLRVHPDTWCVLRRDESVPVGRLRVDVSPSASDRWSE